jgi:hypothetical protein
LLAGIKKDLGNTDRTYGTRRTEPQSRQADL